MDKKTMLKLFGEELLRSLVVLMAILIVGFCAFFVIKVRGDKKLAAENTTEQASTYSDEELQAMLNEDNANDTEEASEETATEEITTEEPTTEEVTTEEPTTEELNIPSNDKKILVLNSTTTNGLASKWMNKLSGAGFTNISKGNYSNSRDAQTTIYVSEEGMGKDLLPYFADAQIVVGTLDSGIDVSSSGVEIFIVIGSNDINVQ
ncbi:MAG: LytR C-terminal domain-containing protein [Lachnospiraceae bacterium]|nr:LytR C-terminal domain-containing protein [Lachnospiraceae bacterium]